MSTARLALWSWKDQRIVETGMSCRSSLSARVSATRTAAHNLVLRFCSITAFVEPTVPTQIDVQTPETLTDWACLILNTPDPDQKVALTREAVKQLRSGAFTYPEGIIGTQRPPDKPPRLPLNSDVKPARMGKGATSTKSQLVYLHNVAHIEQWAIDLAWDLIARFSRPLPNGEAMPLSFFEDWATIAEEEAKVGECEAHSVHIQLRLLCAPALHASTLSTRSERFLLRRLQDARRALGFRLFYLPFHSLTTLHRLPRPRSSRSRRQSCSNHSFPNYRGRRDSTSNDYSALR